MRHQTRLFYWILALAAGLLTLPRPAYAQDLLRKKISVTFRDLPLKNALSGIGKEGGFYFSYNSDMIPGDSLVSLSVTHTTVRAALETLLGDRYDYSQSGTYLIIRSGDGGGKGTTLRGYVVNKLTGESIPNASVYESRDFISTLTDADGYFQLKVREPARRTLVRVSKVNFNDTAFQLPVDFTGEMTIGVSPIRSIMLDSITVTPYSGLEGSWFGKLFISSRQKIQDINLSRFFVRQPFQYSVVPGIGTHGKMSSQVVNKFSLNLLGGYTAGVNGFEIGGLFNIDKKDVRYAQVAGLFNTVGGNVKGFQAGGLYNGVLDSVRGMQAAGLTNRVGGPLKGMQIGGLTNKVSGDVSGFMAAGLYNVALKNMHGVQIGGLFNEAGRVNGVQITGIFNRTRALKGLQIGLINSADSSSGYSLGVFNLIKNGYHQVSVYYDESIDINIAYKSGNRKLYSILFAGLSPERGHRAYSAGFGLGREFLCSGRLSVLAEVTEQGVYLGQWKDLPHLSRLRPSLQWRLKKSIALFAGPSLSVYFGEETPPLRGYASPMPAHHLTFSSKVTGWIGVQAGLTFF